MGVATLITREAFLARPDAEEYELIDGQLKEREMGAIASKVQLRLGHFLVRWDDTTRLGHPFGDGAGLDIFGPGRSYVPRPDGGWISRARLPEGVPEGNFTVAPEMVFEVLSPGNSAIDIEGKVRAYLDAGVDMVWVIYPEARRVHVFHRGSQPAILDAGETLTADVLPGFALPLAELFATLP